MSFVWNIVIPKWFQGVKGFTTVLSEWNALETWQMDYYIYIHFDIHKPA